MDQKTISLFDDLPEDILGRLFEYFHASTLLEIVQVNKQWHLVAMRQLPITLIEQDRARFSNSFFTHGGLLDALCHWYEIYPEDPFSEPKQSLFFQQFIINFWKIKRNILESPYQFINRANQFFIKHNACNANSNAQRIQSEYLERYLKDISHQIDFLFNAQHIEEFLSLYDLKTKKTRRLTHEQEKFLARILQYEKYLESFLTILILFFLIPVEIAFSEQKSTFLNVLNSPYTQFTLQGDGMVAFNHHYPNLIDSLINTYNYELKQSIPLTFNQIEFFLSKLNQTHFIAYLTTLDENTVLTYGFKEAFLRKQPQLILLLSGESKISNIALTYLYKKLKCDLFFQAIKYVPCLFAKMKSLDFLNFLFSFSQLSNHKKGLFAKEFLRRSEFIENLDENQLLQLIKYLDFISLNYLNGIIWALLEINQLSGVLLLELAKLDSHSGLCALLVGANEEARSALSKTENIAYGLTIIKIALESSYKNYDCTLLRESDIAQAVIPDPQDSTSSIIDETTRILRLRQLLHGTSEIEAHIKLLESTENRGNQRALTAFFTLEESYDLWKYNKFNLSEDLQNDLFLHRMAHEKSIERFAYYATNVSYKNNLKQWSYHEKFCDRLYSDAYQFLWKETISSLIKEIFTWANPSIENLFFLYKMVSDLTPLSESKILNSYTPSELYQVCIHLKIAVEILNEEIALFLFFACLPLLYPDDLKALKALYSSNKDILWPKPLINKIDCTLAKKVRQGTAPLHTWHHAITSRQFNIALLLLFISIAAFIPGILFHLMILWTVALAPMAVGIGILTVPLCWTFINWLKSPPQKNQHSSSEDLPPCSDRLSTPSSLSQPNAAEFGTVLQARQSSTTVSTNSATLQLT